jgi:hypothetical protein
MQVDWVNNIKNEPYFDVRSYKAKCDGVHDDAPAINATIIAAGLVNGVVYIPPGVCLVKSPLYMLAKTVITGAGINSTVISVDASFSLASLGVFISQTYYEPGTTVRNLTVSFIQPDSTDIAAYTHWPSAFYMVATPRFTLENIQVLRAWDGVNMTGNSGGAIITNFQCSSFNKGIQIDNSLDSVYLTQIRFWNYGLTTNQSSIFGTTPGNYGLYLGRTDGLQVLDFYGGVTTAIHIDGSGINGAASADLSNINIDGLSKIEIIGPSYLTISNIKITENSIGTYIPLSITGIDAVVSISNMELYPGINGGINTAIYYAGSGKSTLQITNLWAWRVNSDTTIIEQHSGSLLVTNSYFNRYPNIAYTNPTISIIGGRASLIGNRTTDKGTGAGTFISIVNDDWHQSRGNTAVGWTMAYPAIKTSGVYEDGEVSFLPSSYLNLASNEVGVNNAIIPLFGYPMALVPGLSVSVILAHSLQAGANTVNVNSQGAIALKSGKNPANDIAVAYVTGALLTVVWNGSVWLDISQ